ncbi:MAG TPA: ribonuclease H-like domain-containing protein [Anaerolineales bacterium]
MSSLSDRLKNLGVHIGATNIPSPRKRSSFPIETVVEGQSIETPFGQAFVVEGRYPIGHDQGKTKLDLKASLHTIAAWAGEPRLLDLDLSAFIFLDTETSGLSGGTGTYPFLIGVGRFDNQGFRLAQYFMRDPLEEISHLAAFNQFLGSCGGLVSFNGKAFDVPLLNTRFITNGERSPLPEAAHIDLLPLARRLWRDRLPSRALSYLEEQILKVQRTQEDVPGWLIPSLYFDYLRSGDARPLKRVFYHNAMDILSLAALLNHIATLLENPLGSQVEHPIDVFAMGKLFEDLGLVDTAASLYGHALKNDLPEDIHREAVQRWSILEKRRENYLLAIALWQKAASRHEVYAYEELAKYYEHRDKDYRQAIRWTEAAINLISQADYPRLDRRHWLPLFEHRLNRLQTRLIRSQE